MGVSFLCERILLFLCKHKEKGNKKKGFSFFLSCEGKKERNKKERLPAAFFLAEKGMCFRNKMNLLPLGASNSILFFSETHLFFFSPKK